MGSVHIQYALDAAFPTSQTDFSDDYISDGVYSAFPTDQEDMLARPSMTTSVMTAASVKT